MAKYKLKALSVVLGGKVIKKEDKVVIDTKGNFAKFEKNVIAAEEKGFLELVEADKKAPAKKAPAKK